MKNKKELIQLLSNYNFVSMEVDSDSISVLFADCNDFSDYNKAKELGFKTFYGDGNAVAFIAI